MEKNQTSVLGARERTVANERMLEVGQWVILGVRVLTGLCLGVM